MFEVCLLMPDDEWSTIIVLEVPNAVDGVVNGVIEDPAGPGIVLSLTG